MIFSVVAYHHPEHYYNALLRFLKTPNGERTRKRVGHRYKKFNFEDAVEFIKNSKPSYTGGMPHKVPKDDVVRIIRPREGLRGLIDEKHPDITKIVEILLERNVKLESLGVTGSHLAGLNRPSSDIDLVVYGSNEFKSARAALKQGIKSSVIQEPDEKIWKQIYMKRDPELNLKEFVRHEKRKLNKGIVNGTRFDLLFVRGWNEINEGPSKGEKLERETIEARVTDDTWCFDSPSIYEIKHPDINRVVSYTHTYAGQVFRGEKLQARGWIEKSDRKVSLVVGTSRKARGEWIKSLTLLEE